MNPEQNTAHFWSRKAWVTHSWWFVTCKIFKKFFAGFFVKRIDPYHRFISINHFNIFLVEASTRFIWLNSRSLNVSWESCILFNSLYRRDAILHHTLPLAAILTQRLWFDLLFTRCYKEDRTTTSVLIFQLLSCKNVFVDFGLVSRGGNCRNFYTEEHLEINALVNFSLSCWMNAVSKPDWANAMLSNENVVFALKCYCLDITQLVLEAN